jgi:carboxypeptidase PM20D1
MRHNADMGFIEKFREAVKQPTYWPKAAEGENEAAAESVLLRFQEFLADKFPAFHKAASYRVAERRLSPYSVVYHLPGCGPDAQSNAVLFLAHYDVVPAEKEKWSFDPFGAEEKEGFIYGRGSLDMKGILIGILEAAENLCAQGWKPNRDIWFAFGGDEERTGILGAMETARWFEGRGQRFAWILDEGTPIAENQIKGIDTPLALISVEEKGYLSLKLSVTQEPGHASRPPKVQAAAVLGRALCRIAKKPFPFKLTSTVETFFKQIAPFMPGAQGFVMRHARAFGPLFFRAAASNPATESMLRTTAAMTQIEGSTADNVLPSEVSAIINIRLLRPWTAESAAAFIEKAIGDRRVRLSVYGLASDPVAPGSPSLDGGDGDYRRSGWQEIEAAVKEAWPGILLLPFIMIATTDSRHYQKLSDNIFRFSPHKLDSKELGGVHGHNERISLENLNRGLSFYTALMKLL